MAELLSFFVILLAGLFLSEVFSRLHLPWVVTLILAGILIGPFGLQLFTLTPTIEFLGEIGLVFLMFMAGLKIKFSSFVNRGGTSWNIALINGVIPFLAGLGIGLYFGYGLPVAFMLGTIFISSSIAVVIPSLEANKIIDTKLGKSIVTATVIEDVASLILLSIFLQTVTPLARIPLPIFYPLLIIFLVVLKWLIPKVERLFFSKFETDRRDWFEKELRLVFTILIGTVVVFQLLGLHSIIAGFFAGLALSGSIKSELLIKKLHAISYGLFIPIFFVVVGASTNIGVFFEATNAILITIFIVLGSILSKFLSGWAAGKISKFTSRESALIGVSTIPQLSTTLAVVFSGLELGLFDQEIMTAMITLSVVTTLLGPILINKLILRGPTS